MAALASIQEAAGARGGGRGLNLQPVSAPGEAEAESKGEEEEEEEEVDLGQLASPALGTKSAAALQARQALEQMDVALFGVKAAEPKMLAPLGARRL
jgi:hypothetical protein